MELETERALSRLRSGERRLRCNRVIVVVSDVLTADHDRISSAGGVARPAAITTARQSKAEHRRLLFVRREPKYNRFDFQLHQNGSSAGQVDVIYLCRDPTLRRIVTRNKGCTTSSRFLARIPPLSDKSACVSHLSPLTSRRATEP